MARRPTHQRPAKDIKPGRVGSWPLDGPEPSELARRVRYIASGEHKNHPPPTGLPRELWTMSLKSDKSKCDKFSADGWGTLQQALHDAIVACCVSDDFDGQFPKRVWAYVNGVLHEARLSNRDQGVYHGFPLEYPEQFPVDPSNALRNAPRVTVAIN